jgi:3-dehydroquinate dehydratase type I
LADTLVPKWMNSSSRNKVAMCVSLMPRNTEEAAKLLGEADESPAQYVELRLDGYLGDPSALRRHLEALGKPLVLTYSEDPRLNGGSRLTAAQLEALVDLAEFVDLPASLRVGGRAKRIASIHVWRSIGLEEGRALVDHAWANGCDLVKLVFKAESLADNLTALELTSTLGVPNIVFCMGEVGATSRILAPLCGSKWTYVCLKRGLETAPGQLDVHTMAQIYRLLAGDST